MAEITKVRIDPEFHSLIPPLDADERLQLEANIKADGCRDAIVSWSGLLLDGHNRKEICDRYGVGYSVKTMDFPDRDAAKVWIIRNQFGRRNINDFQRAELCLAMKPLLAERAKENQKSVGGDRRSLCPNSDKAIFDHAKAVSEPVNTGREIAKTAGVSRDTIHKTEKIKERAAEPVQKMARAGTISILAASTVADLPKPEQEKLAAAGPTALAKRATDERKKQAAQRVEAKRPAAELRKPKPEESFGGAIDLQNKFSKIVSDLRMLSGGMSPEELSSLKTILAPNVIKSKRDDLKGAVSKLNAWITALE